MSCPTSYIYIYDDVHFSSRIPPVENSGLATLEGGVISINWTNPTIIHCKLWKKSVMQHDGAGALGDTALGQHISHVRVRLHHVLLGIWCVVYDIITVTYLTWSAVHQQDNTSSATITEGTKHRTQRKKCPEDRTQLVDIQHAHTPRQRCRSTI